MKVNIKKKYYKNTKIGREPITYKATQKKGIGTDVNATVYIDPILRKKVNKNLLKGMIRHEESELKAWGKGKNATHIKARSKEPKYLQNIGGVSGFWKYQKRKGNI